MPATEEVPPAIPDHPAHPGHNLKRTVNGGGGSFKCHGCMERGAGTRYRCDHERCNFELHTSCAVAPPTFTHPLLGDRVFVFLLEASDDTTTASGGMKRGVCVACGGDVRGFVYHCFDDGLDLHPCCASLPLHAARDGRNSVLRQEAPLLPEVTVDNNSPAREIRPAAARHRRWWARLGRQAGWRDPAPEHTLLDGRVVELRQEASSGPCDVSHDRNRERERQPPAARHRRWMPRTH